MFEAKPISHAKNSRHILRHGKISICNNNRSQHGLLFNAFIRWSKKVVCNKLTLGALPIQHVTHRSETSHWYISTENGCTIFLACQLLSFTWTTPLSSAMPIRQSSSWRYQSLTQTASSWIPSQPRQMSVVSTSSNLPRLLHHQKWNKTASRKHPRHPQHAVP